jgi:hypothetical protein
MIWSNCSISLFFLKFKSNLLVKRFIFLLSTAFAVALLGVGLTDVYRTVSFITYRCIECFPVLCWNSVMDVSGSHTNCMYCSRVVRYYFVGDAAVTKLDTFRFRDFMSKVYCGTFVVQN